MHYYKFNISSWYLNTNHLSLEEEAVYFRLINHYYDSEQPIPIETQAVIRRLRLVNYSDLVSDILKEFFILEDDGWHHKTCDEIINDYQGNAEKNAINGKKGGRPKKNNPSETHPLSENNPNESLTTNYKLLTNNYKLKAPDGVSDSVFDDFVKLRKGLKAPVTETAIKGLKREGEKAGMTLEQVMSLCCQNGWRGFKAEWVKDKVQNKTQADKTRDVLSGLTRGLLGANNDVKLL